MYYVFGNFKDYWFSWNWPHKFCDSKVMTYSTLFAFIQKTINRKQLWGNPNLITWNQIDEWGNININCLQEIFIYTIQGCLKGADLNMFSFRHGKFTCYCSIFKFGVSIVNCKQWFNPCFICSISIANNYSNNNSIYRIYRNVEWR